MLKILNKLRLWSRLGSRAARDQDLLRDETGAMDSRKLFQPIRSQEELSQDEHGKVQLPGRALSKIIRAEAPRADQKST